MKSKLALFAVFSVALAVPSWAQQAQPVGGKPATATTKAANEVVSKVLPFNDKADSENAQRGFIAHPDTLKIIDTKGTVAWDLEAYKAYIGLDRAAPTTINPSLWRNAQLKHAIRFVQGDGPYLPDAQL